MRTGEANEGLGFAFPRDHQKVDWYPGQYHGQTDEAGSRAVEQGKDDQEQDHDDEKDRQNQMNLLQNQSHRYILIYIA